MEFEIGDAVKFLGCTKEQILWGGNDDPTNILLKNQKYYIEHVDVHSQHTKLKILGIEGKFNSVCFEKV